MIPESDESKTWRLQILLPVPVVFGARWIVVDCPIEFDTQSGFCTEEVEDVMPDAMLTAELESAKTPISDNSPEASLGWGRAASQCLALRMLAGMVCVPFIGHGD